ncbi:unnamed protein product [Gadus morhua 'NCC']
MEQQRVKTASPLHPGTAGSRRNTPVMAVVLNVPYALNLSGFGGRGRDEPSAQRWEESRQQIVKSSDGGRKRRGARRQHGPGPADG